VLTAYEIVCGMRRRGVTKAGDEATAGSDRDAFGADFVVADPRR